MGIPMGNGMGVGMGKEIPSSRQPCSNDDILAHSFVSVSSVAKRKRSPEVYELQNDKRENNLLSPYVKEGRIERSKAVQKPCPFMRFVVVCHLRSCIRRFCTRDKSSESDLCREGLQMGIMGCLVKTFKTSYAISFPY